MNKKFFLDEIIALIESGHEGSYWDFKQQWYSKDKSGDMLHDIICMANNLANRDAYIIIGVSDDYTMCGVNDSTNRKTTQNLTDFLRDKKFAGGFRPNVEVRHVKINEIELDIICIEKSEFVPHYLEEGYKGVIPYNIYTRVQDSNTPKNKSADLIHIEMLWKRRFHILDNPLQKIKYFLEQKKDWVDNTSTINGTSKYYKYSPEYTIKIQSTDGDAIETCMLTQLDKHGYWLEISLYYHQTILFQKSGIALDGGRYITVYPAVGSLYHQSKQIFYHYFIKDSMSFALYKFFIHDEDSRDYLANQRFTEETLFFENDEERQDFETQFNLNLNAYEKILQSIKNAPNHRTIPQMQEEYNNRLALKKFKQVINNYID